ACYGRSHEQRHAERKSAGHPRSWNRRTPSFSRITLPKPALEFFRPDDVPWRPVAGSATGGAGGPGIEEKILSRDPETGDVTRLPRGRGPAVSSRATAALRCRSKRMRSATIPARKPSAIR